MAAQIIGLLMPGDLPEIVAAAGVSRERSQPHPIAEGVVVCVNCGARVAGKYCSECGQRQMEAHEWSLAHFFGHLLHEITHLESNKILRTLVTLLFRPGQLAENYLKGRWRECIGPIRVYLTCSALFFLLAWSSVLSFSRYDSRAGMVQAMTAISDAKGIPLAQYTEHFQHNLHRYAGILWFAGVFAVAGILKALYRRSGIFYVQHLVFALYLWSFEFLLRVTAVGLHRLGSLLHGSAPGWTHWLLYGVQAIYVYFALRRVYGESPLLAATKAVTLSVLSFGLMFAVIFLGTEFAFWVT